MLHAKSSPESMPDILFIPIKIPSCKQALLAPLLLSLSHLATILIVAGECSIYKMNYFADVQNPSRMPSSCACPFFQLPYCSALFLESQQQTGKTTFRLLLTEQQESCAGRIELVASLCKYLSDCALLEK